eukprot:scpid20930/ scgid6949/ Transposon Ty3-G Gag-Pol polyprotein; Gag3-Pol3; Transposon Ty3-1 TYA-TYB polyprotein; Capsid protein; p24; Spacer peptide p3; Nucleocapsid protein p11; Ty3 protease; p16; Spacer peptide J; Reverse transcriptase/ribonuclease H; p55; Integrase p61; Integrase p58
MARFQPPSALDFSSPDQWQAWKLRFGRFRAATKLTADSEETQVATLLYALGPSADSVFDFQLGLSADEKKKYDDVVKAFDGYFRPSTNIVHERSKFERIVQQPSQTVEQFVRQLYKAAEYCDFADTKDDRIRDRFVAHMMDRRVSREIQMKEDSEQTLSKVLAFARQAEAVQQQVATQARSGQNSATLDSSASAVGAHGRGKSRFESASAHSTSSKCQNCGGARHEHRDQCPASGRTCAACEKRNHFTRVCRSKPATSSAAAATQQPNHGGSHESHSDQSTSLFVGSTTGTSASAPWMANLSIGTSNVPFKLDTGGDVSTMAVECYNTLQPKPSLSAPTASLKGGDDDQPLMTVTLGQWVGVQAHCTHKHCQSPPTSSPLAYPSCCAGRRASTSLLSRSACTTLGLVQRLDTVHSPTSTPLVQCMVGPPVTIHLKPDATPYHCVAPRRVPHHLFGKVREELNRMREGDIIEKVEEPTDWCFPMVPVLKPTGKVRVCVDLKRLNASVKRETYQLPTIDDTLSRLAGATVFTTLDTANGFWQIPLDPETARLTTFITPFGRFYFKRLLFGITSAPEIFQRRVSNLLDHLPGVAVHMDDIIVSGTTMEEHDRHLAAVLAVLREANVTLNKDKCCFRQSQVTFLGHIVTAGGVLPNPARVSALQNLPAPTNVTELRQILGMFNFLSRFIPNLSDVNTPLRCLLRDDTAWQWSPVQQAALDSLKQLASTAPCLVYFDTSRPTIVSADASSY